MNEEMTIDGANVENLTVGKLSLFDIAFGLQGIATALELILENEAGGCSHFSKTADNANLNAAYELALGARALATINREIICQEICDRDEASARAFREQEQQEARNEH